MKSYPFQRGEFTILRKIGDGGMAEVFLAERGGDEGFKTRVAMKRLHAGFALDQYFIRQLVQEGKLLGHLQHNNIVRVHDLRRIEDEYFIVMEYIDGLDLAQVVQVHRDHDLRLPLAVFFHVALSLCEALEYAHTAGDLEGKPMRLIHRDIKPSNVLLSHRGTVKLTDFGIARVGDASNTGSIVKGTANYMSPEQASGEQALTPGSDIFSLGAVFWEMLTLEKLVEGSNYLNVIHAIKELNVGLKDITRKGIEPGLRMILLRMLARKRDLRYQSMGLVLKDLRFVADQMKVDLSPSALRDYMVKTTNLARAAVAEDRHAGDSEDPTPASVGPETPATPIPRRRSVGPADPLEPTRAAAGAGAYENSDESPSTDKALDEPASFQDDVAALKALIQDPNAAPTPSEAASSSSPSAPPEPQTGPPQGDSEAFEPAEAKTAPPQPPLASAPTARPQPPLPPPPAPKPQVPQASTASSVLAQAAGDPGRPLVRSNAQTEGSLAAIEGIKEQGVASSAPPPQAPQAALEIQPPPPSPLPIAPELSQEYPPDSVFEDGVEDVPDDPYLEDGFDDEYYRSTRRANQLVVGAGAGLFLLFAAVLFMFDFGSDSEGDELTGEASDVVGKPDDTGGFEDGFGPSDGALTDTGSQSEFEGSAEMPSERGVASDVEANKPSVVDDGRSASRPSSRDRPASRGGLDSVPERTPPPASSTDRLEDEDSDWSFQPSARARIGASRDPGEGDDGWGSTSSAAESEGLVEGVSGDQLIDDPASSGSPEILVASLAELAPDLKTRAPRGRLSESEVATLRAIEVSSADFNESRALLLAQFDGSRDVESHCSVAAEVVARDQNRLNPQFNLEFAKCHLRQGRYREALESSRLAELHAQEIPTASRTDRQLKIWEVQAKAFKGLYQVTDDLDYIGDSVAVWERYRHLARSTYRQRESTLADEAIRGLLQLQDGAL